MTLRLVVMVCTVGILVACQSPVETVPATAVLVRVDCAQEVCTKTEALRLRVAVQDEQDGPWVERPTLTLPTDVLNAGQRSFWPVEVPLTPRDPSHLPALFEVVAQAVDERGAVLVEQRALTRFLERSQLTLAITLAPCGDLALGSVCEKSADCHGIGCQTCRTGGCDAIDVTNPTKLAPVGGSAGAVAGKAGGGTKRPGNAGAAGTRLQETPDAGPGGSTSGSTARDSTPDSDPEQPSGPERAIEKLDILFMVDNSNSMADEQQSLKAAFGDFLGALTAGKTLSGTRFTPVTDLHVGVVSSDMGTPGFDIPSSCHAGGGDDAKLQHISKGAGCSVAYPAFLSFGGDAQNGSTSDVVKFANDFGCIAALGTGGCGFEQQLEAPFKALWPSVFLGPDGAEQPNPYSFLATTEQGRRGKGDVPEAQGGNLGFLRNAGDSPSLIAIVVVTDEEDCSVSSVEHLKPSNLLTSDSPYRKEPDLNLRCLAHPEFNYDVIERYYKGFRMLRQGHEDRVVFAAIGGVPPDLVTKDRLPDFSDEAARNQFYDNILADPAMQQVIDPATNPGMGQGNLTPSCHHPVGNVISTAYPPRRIVELAKAFGRNGMMQSICADDLRFALDAIADTIGRRIGSN